MTNQNHNTPNLDPAAATSTGYTVSQFYNNGAVGGEVLQVGTPHDTATIANKKINKLYNPFTLPSGVENMLTLSVGYLSGVIYFPLNNIEIWEETAGTDKYLIARSQSQKLNEGHEVKKKIYLNEIGPQLRLNFEPGPGGLVIIGTADTIGDPGMDLPVIEKTFQPSMAQVIEVSKTNELEIETLFVNVLDGHGLMMVPAGNPGMVFPLSLPIGRAAAHELSFTCGTMLVHNSLFLWQEPDQEAGGAYVMCAAQTREPMPREVVQRMALDARWYSLSLQFGFSMGNGGGSGIIINQLKGI